MLRLRRFAPCLLVASLFSACSDERGAPVQVSAAVHHDVSPPLRDLKPLPARARTLVRSALPIPRPPSLALAGQVLDLPPREAFIDATITNFEGMGAGLSGFAVSSAPPDPAGDIGPNHYVQVVNTSYAVFDRTGRLVFGPVATNTLWQGFGGGCEVDNDGDAVVKYDRMADRWVITQFSVNGGNGPFFQCVAVSTSPDPTGSWARYAFQYTGFNDYPKLSVWPNAYYMTFNMFPNDIFAGAKVCAYDRTKMLAAQPATQQCFDTNSNYGGLLVSDLDGPTQPPAGSPAYVVSLGISNNDLAFWKLHIDWANPQNSLFTGPTAVAVQAYTAMCNGTQSCVTQPGTTTKLDGLDDRLMYRAAYRNFGDHEAMLAIHSVQVTSGGGVRWYELRDLGASSPTVFQQGTHGSTGSYRWMGSAAMDGNGGIALGFSLSSSTTYPSIHYAGRVATDAAGTMAQGEGTIIDGTGAQTGVLQLTRWGDYTMMGIDPVDDCTFWYTNQYLSSNGEFNWRTRIGSFRLPGCGAQANDFAISASPSTVSAQAGTSTDVTVSTAVTAGSAQSVALSVSGLPSGVTAAFNPTSVTAGDSSTLTLDVGAAAAPGSYSITITGTAASGTHSTSVLLTVQAVPNDFALSVSPSSVSPLAGTSTSVLVSTAVTSGTTQTIALSVAGLPSGVAAAFDRTSVAAGDSATLTLDVGAAAAPGSYTITITGSAASGTHSTSLLLTVVAPIPDDFAISVSPSSVSALGGTSTDILVSTSVTSGNAQSVAFSVSGLPNGVSAAFNPTFVTAGGSSTLTITVGAATPPGSYALTITGTGAAATHSTSVGLTVVPPIITNGGFETGTLAGWSASGNVQVVTDAHSGTYAARVGSPTPSRQSTLRQTFTVPSTGGVLTFWYLVVCPDVLRRDWANVTLDDATTGTITTVLPRTCTNDGIWLQRTFDLAAFAGHTVTLTLGSHDDASVGNATYTQYDDISVH